MLRSIDVETAVESVVEAIHTDDIIVSSGDVVSNIVVLKGRSNITVHGNSVAIATGLSMTTEKKVFLLCDDTTLLMNMNSILNFTLSRSKNLYMIVFASDYHNGMLEFPSLFSEIMSPKSMFFNIGLTVHDYTKQLLNYDNPIKEIESTIYNITGPLVSIVNVDMTGIQKSF